LTLDHASRQRRDIRSSAHITPVSPLHRAASLAGSGSNTPEEPHEAASVQGKGAFADPAALADFVNFLRRKGEELAARAVVSIVPKAAVAFPQVGGGCNNLGPD
jgi:hypothetical protein